MTACPPLTALQVDTIKRAICVFETGRPEIDDKAYSTLAVMDDGAGFSYGAHQFTRGSLGRVLERYVEIVRNVDGADGVRWLQTYLDSVDYGRGFTPASTVLDGHPRTGDRWTAWGPVNVKAAGMLVDLGVNPPMQRAQREVYDELYWQPP